MTRTPGLFVGACVLAAFALGTSTAHAAGGAVFDGGAAPALMLQAGVIPTTDASNLLKNGATDFEIGAKYVLQLDGPQSVERRTALAAAGVELGQYLPRNAYIVRRISAAPADVAAVGFVRWAGRYENSWKISPEVGMRAHATPERQAIAARGNVAVYVTLFEGERAADHLDTLRAIGGSAVLWSGVIGGNAVVSMTLPGGAVGGLAEIAAVQFVEETPEVTLRNSSNRWLAQSDQFEVTPVYDAGIHGEGQIIGIIDGRVDVNHCSFVDLAFPPNTVGPTHRKVLAYNTTFSNNDHGTHVAGIAVGDNGDDTDTRGLAYLAKMVFNYLPAFTEQGVIGHFNLHHSQGARIHTNSWGNDGTTAYDALCRGIDVFGYDNEEDLVTLAITNASNLRNPENAKNLLAVAATQDAPNESAFCIGGSGPTTDGRRKPEILAPGCQSSSADGSSSTMAHCGVRNDTGTSMATPVIAASAALVRQYYMDGHYPTGTSTEADEFTPTAALVKATLLNSAVDMADVAGYPNEQEGWGRVLLDGALYFPGDARKMMVLDDVRNADGLALSDLTEHHIDVTGASETLKVTLAWTEPAATSGVFEVWINDLDLEVIAPDNTVYKGNVFSDGRSVSGGAKDDRNNVEQVLVDAPPAGTWTVRVTAAVIADPQFPQGYALIATGEVQAAATATGACCAGGVCAEVGGAAACDPFVCNVTPLLPVTFTGCFGDADGNGFVNPGDRGFVSANIGQTVPTLLCMFDLDGNGFVTPGDRGYASANIGQCTPLPDYQNGSGLNHGVPDTRFGGYMGDGTSCASITCP